MNKYLIGVIILLLAICGVHVLQSSSVLSDKTVNVDLSDLEVKENLIVNQQTSMDKKLFNTTQPDTNAVLVENNSSLDLESPI